MLAKSRVASIFIESRAINGAGGLGFESWSESCVICGTRDAAMGDPRSEEYLFSCSVADTDDEDSSVMFNETLSMTTTFATAVLVNGASSGTTASGTVSLSRWSSLVLLSASHMSHFHCSRCVSP